MVELKSLKLLKPVLFLIVMAIAGLLASCILITTWCITAKKIELYVDSSSEAFHSQLRSQVKNTRILLHPLSSSATNLARVLSSSNGTNILKFSHIQKKVAPLLFEALLIVPYASQVSYTSKDGLSFAYFIDGDKIFAAYSNSSTWYMQEVYRDSEELFGEAIKISPLVTINSSWFQAALNDPDGYSTVDSGWKSAHELNFLTAASVDGIGVISMGFPVKVLSYYLTDIQLYGGSLYLATKDGKGLLQGIPNTLMTVNDNSVSFVMVLYNNVTFHIGDVQCDNGDGTLNQIALKIQQTKYTFYCSPMDIVGVPMVYALAFQEDELASSVSRNLKLAHGLLIPAISILLMTVSAFIPIYIKGIKMEMELRPLLKKQMEATQQAERKSMNKSHAIARASHDIRANLSGITGLIELCDLHAAPGSDLKSNLSTMTSDIDDLLSLLNSILDTSKIEAGKMQLEDEEFNLFQLIEGVVDLYHTVGMKKGVDVILDTCDNSVIKFCQVRGDRVRLKQVLDNMLNNAVKFTSEGHVSLRAWVQKRSLEKCINASNHDGTWNCLSCLFHKNKDTKIDVNTVNVNKQNSTEFVFEVDDTGIGIPKEQQESVFENYVQVKETALEGGTGLGLGIVQSIVRLMGGEINIVDKEVGKRGTCFRFNVFLTVCESGSSNNEREDDIELEGNESIRHSNFQLTRLIMLTSGQNSCSPTPKFSPKHETSRAFLLIQNDERRGVVQRFMEKLGVKVIGVNQWDDFLANIKKVRHKLSGSSSGMFELSSRSDLTCPSAAHDTITTTKDILLGSRDSTDCVLPVSCRKTNVRSPSNFVIIVIDFSVVPLPGVYKKVAEIKRGLGGSGSCQVVWLQSQVFANTSSTFLETDQDDITINKPLHGTRLFELVRILPEFGGTSQGKFLGDPNLPVIPSLVRETSESFSSATQPQCQQPLREPEITEVFAPTRKGKPLDGKKVLIVEDSPTLQLVTSAKLKRLGATVEKCDNGGEAVSLFIEGLKRLKEMNSASLLPYDYIFMDCEMPVMNGYEATKKIRKFEESFGVHIPIVALTAHSSPGEAKKSIEAGMDAHLIKPFEEQILLDSIRNVTNILK